MICPFCGKEMNKGYGRGLSRQLHRNSYLYWNDSERKMGLLSNGQKLSADNHNFGCPAVLAYKCDDCKKIIMDTHIIEES